MIAAPASGAGVTINTGSNSIPTITPTLSPNAVRFNIEFELPGIGNNAELGQNSNPYPERPVFLLLTIYDFDDNPIGGGLIVASYDSSTESFKGLVGVDNLPQGQYIIKLTTSATLEKRVPGIYSASPNQTLSLPSVVLVPGDINLDNEINLSDYNLIISCYGSSFGSGCPKEDLNIDGIVDEKDLNIFYSGLASRQGD